jgi:hypothetical protein
MIYFGETESLAENSAPVAAVYNRRSKCRNFATLAERRYRRDSGSSNHVTPLYCRSNLEKFATLTGCRLHFG